MFNVFTFFIPHRKKKRLSFSTLDATHPLVCPCGKPLAYARKALPLIMYSLSCTHNYITTYVLPKV